MAGRTLNRRDLRKQAEVAEQRESSSEPASEKTPPKKVRKTPAVRKPRAAKVPPRMRARWCIYDGAMKPVAVFDYNQRGAADAKLADLAAKAKGIHFLQVIKEPMPVVPPPEGDGPTAPPERSKRLPASPTAKTAAKTSQQG